MTSHASARPLHITVVADNPETMDGMLAYFGRAGISTRGTRALGELCAIASASTAVVVFPDDFDAPEVAATIAHLQGARPRVLIVLITREPRRFTAARDARSRSIPIVILPKPSFGWSILDAIRAHVDRETGRA